VPMTRNKSLAASSVRIYEITAKNARRFISGARRIRYDLFWNTLYVGRSAQGVEFIYVSEGPPILITSEAIDSSYEGVEVKLGWVRVFSSRPDEQLKIQDYSSSTGFLGMELTTVTDIMERKLFIAALRGWNAHIVVRNPRSPPWIRRRT
jgi:hypothetical protein